MGAGFTGYIFRRYFGPFIPLDTGPSGCVAALGRKGEGLPALGAPEQPPPAATWRPSARRRATAAALTVLALGLAVVVVASGPPEPVTFGLRLPLLVLASGAAVNAVQWRRRVSVTADEVILRDLVRVRRIPLRAVTRVEADAGRVTLRTRGRRKAVVRAVPGPATADEFARAVVAAAGPGARLTADPAPAPAPVVTPWLIMVLAVAAGLFSAEGFTVDPALVTAALGAGGVASCAALACFWYWDRPGREPVSETGS